MSGFTYKHGAQKRSNFYDKATTENGQGPWQINVWSNPDINSDGTETYTVSFSKKGDNDQVYITITNSQGETVNSGGEPGIGTYADATVNGQFNNSNRQYGDVFGDYDTVYMVASLAKYKNDSTNESDWHLYALTLGGDPEDVGTIGAQGG